jgi:hypothetical protein
MSERVKFCEYCEEREATHLQEGTEVCPTDRGDIVTYNKRWVCDECDHPITRAAIRWPGRFLYD